MEESQLRIKYVVLSSCITEAHGEESNAHVLTEIWQLDGYLNL